MTIRTVLLLILICLIGWFNKEQFISQYINELIIITILFSLKYFNKKAIEKIKGFTIAVIIIVLYIIISAFNSYIDKSITRIIMGFNIDNVNLIEDKAKSLYYSEILNNISINDKLLSHETFSMNLEIDRELNHGKILSSRIVNFSLNFISSPYLPTSITFGKIIPFSVSYVVLVLLLPYILVLEIDGQKKLIKCFTVLCFSGFLLASIGIYLRFLYLNESDYFYNLGLDLWAPPEPRIFFSSFSYKNHWSAYAIMSVSMVFTLNYIILKKTNFEILRNNLFFFQILILIIFIISIFYSNSNSGIILVSFFTLFSLFFFNKGKLILNRFYFIFFPVLIILSYFSLKTDVFLRGYDLINGDSFRFYLWGDALNQIQSKTFWGYGINSYKAINGIFQSVDVTSARHQNLINAHQFYIPLTLHAHSDFLQITSEIGFFGLCLVVFPIFFLILRSLLLFSENPLPLISLGLFTILIYSVVDFPLRNIAVIIMFLFLLILCETRMKFFNRKS